MSGFWKSRIIYTVSYVWVLKIPTAENRWTTSEMVNVECDSSASSAWAECCKGRQIKWNIGQTWCLWRIALAGPRLQDTESNLVTNFASQHAFMRNCNLNLFACSQGPTDTVIASIAVHVKWRKHPQSSGPNHQKHNFLSSQFNFQKEIFQKWIIHSKPCWPRTASQSSSLPTQMTKPFRITWRANLDPRQFEMHKPKTRRNKEMQKRCESNAKQAL